MGMIKYDGSFDIATGRSRKELSWCNDRMQWSSLVDKLSVTCRTAETFAQYMASAKSRQDEIKDVGGFVGGFVNGGRRKAENIAHRQLLTLDVDFATPTFWEDFTELYGNAAVLYSTHKNSADARRLRLVMPIDRPVGADEYVAVARRVAQRIGIDQFDDTTYEPSRLMYWPSTPTDGEWLFEFQDGRWLCADELLASVLPVGERSSEVVRHEIKRQGHPSEKQGLIGAFCRAYTIHEAIAEYLSDVYEQCGVSDRYSYRGGTTAAGLVTYDDVYAYSHHGSDPAGSRLCNAFDLVRLHKFGETDASAKEGTPNNRLPSFLAMVELVAKDVNVKRIINRQRAEVTLDGWADELDIDRKGVLRGTIANYERILRGDPNLKGVFRYNEFKNVMEVAARLPWRRAEDGGQWRDSDDTALRGYIEKKYETLSRSNLPDALSNVYQENRYHPVRDYLEAQAWDGVPRVEGLFVEYLGAEDSPYVRAVTRKALAAAVARIFRPGTKFDNVVVLVGAQGVGKSTILKKLGGGWFSDNFHAVQGKDAVEQIQGVWIMEIGELAGLRKAEVEAIKSYISTLEDRCRLAYSRRVESFPRQCVFFGTTNKRDFLNDPTGNRRFWPIEVGESAPRRDIFVDLDDSQVGQIWAEAVHLYRQGEALYLSRELEEFAKSVQHGCSEQDERVGIVQEFLDTPLPESWGKMREYERRSYLDDSTAGGGKLRVRVCLAEIWCECFRGNRKDLDRRASMDLNRIMRKIEGWEASKFPVEVEGYGRQRVYKRVWGSNKAADSRYAK